MKFTHEWIEKNVWLLIGLVLLVISFGGLVEIVPLFFQSRPPNRSPASNPIRRCAWPGATSTSARAATAATRR